MYKGVETIPFFLFNMYGTRHINKDTTYNIVIYVNDKELDKSKLNGREKESLFGSLNFFEQLKKNNFLAVDPKIIEKRFKGRLSQNLYNIIYKRLTNYEITDSAFFNWYAKYLSQVAGQQTDSFAILRSSVIWKPHFKQLNDTVSFIKYVAGRNK
jgi:hypothetical protein